MSGDPLDDTRDVFYDCPSPSDTSSNTVNTDHERESVNHESVIATAYRLASWVLDTAASRVLSVLQKIHNHLGEDAVRTPWEEDAVRHRREEDAVRFF